MNLFWHLVLWAVVSFGIGVAISCAVAHFQWGWPKPPVAKSPGRTVQTVRRGYRAHAADIWRCDPADVTEEMEKAAKRDLYAAQYNAPYAKRREWIERDGALPSLPDASILWPDVDISKPPAQPPLTKFDVWIEGFITNGEKVPAQLVAKDVTAPSWLEACVEAIRQAGWDLRDFDRHRLTYFGCRLFDNEEAARGNFG